MILPETNYRIIEYLNKFKIQKKKIETTSNGYLWWKKRLTEEYWYDLDEKGHYTYVYKYYRTSYNMIGTYKVFDSEMIKWYETKEEAKNFISLLIKGEIIHPY